MRSKKGFAIELIGFVIIGIIAVMFFMMFIYGFNILNTNLTNGAVDTPNTNLTHATEQTFSYVNSGMSGPGGLKLIAAIMIIGFMLATLITAYFSSRHPLWMFVYILITILVVIFSVYISNSYTALMSNSTFGATISSFGIAGFIMSHLPIWTTLIGLLGISLSIVGVYIRRGNEV